MSKQKLFNAFNPVTAKTWKQQIQFDLNGADYNETLIWHTNEDLNVKPFYNSEDLKDQLNIPISTSTDWTINHPIYVFNDQKANTKSLSALNNGAEAITFIIPSADCNVELLLKDIPLNTVPVYFNLQFCEPGFINLLNKIAEHRNTCFYIFSDIIGHLAESGNWYSTLKQDFSNLELILKTNPYLKSTVSINADLYQNAGATITQQLAYTLCHANEYLKHFQQQFNTLITFKVSIGANYFFEIAKLRALRLLWETLASAYNLNPDCHIVATPTKRNKTLYDYHTNMLRTTTECMSAILGGADSISNLNYDGIFHKDNAFSSRIARNQLLILKHETYLNKVINPAEGVYYIETLTQQLAEKALELFKHIEAHNGFLKQLKDGIIQKKIKESAKKEQEAFNNSELILLGTNKHPNPLDSMKNEIELYPFVKTTRRKTLIEPLISKRLAETLEQERLKNES